MSTACSQANVIYGTATYAAENTQTFTLLPSPTNTPELIDFPATVWDEEPRIPIITFHQFKQDGTPSDANGHKMTYGDLQSSLQSLYDSGFTLISLADWLSGNLSVPAGRRPLIITLDDLFYTNQILLDDSGQPNADTGIGIIWEFSREHPDFGFHLALFAVMGDKYYPFDPQYASQPNHLGKDWQQEMAKTIIWCLENDALVLNHTYLHGYLSNVDNPVSMTEFLDQLRQNDEAIRYYLHLAGRDDLIPRLGNIIALPGGAQPQSEADWERLQAYENPEGLPVQAILGIASAAADPAKLEYLVSPYDGKFNKYRVPRLVATLKYIQYITENNEGYPEAESCTVTVEKSRMEDVPYLTEQITRVIETGSCSPGLYYFNGMVFNGKTQPVGIMNMP